ncbi:mitochondrial ATPase inhibitor, IATP-domain-containing protein [Tuber indicum]|nr:mitochondrial ATPase inhibitor, IATP-domain-containing protein [Tuber indicum]KAG0635336.1 mitochondrial ATPase inhibitor, IATP-domain-containing protein [Tuber brumale]
MLRTTIARTLRVNRIVMLRPYTEGATGSGTARPGGEAAGDAFTKREKANEDFYVRAQERAKLLQLKEKLANQRKHLDELDAHIDELTREQGGENN